MPATLGIVLLLLLAVTREATAARVRRLAPAGASARRWRAARAWQTGALALAAAALIPGVISRPSPPLLGQAYSLLDRLSPLLLVAAAGAFAMAARLIGPWAWRQLRRYGTGRSDTAAAEPGEAGLNPQHTPRTLRDWVRENGPEFHYRFDVGTAAGVANLLIDTDEARYSIYILAPEQLNQGLSAALARAAEIGEALGAQAIIWIADTSTRQAYRSTTHPVDLVSGGIPDILRLVAVKDRAARRRRERRERRLRQEEQRQGRVSWGSQDAEAAREGHDGEAWERFVRKAPIHPYMRSRLFRRHEGRCALCGEGLETAEPDWEAQVADYDHACQNPATTQLIPHGERQALRYEMPDCEQCLIDTPGHFDSCIERLAPVHPQCWRAWQASRQRSDTSEAEASA